MAINTIAISGCLTKIILQISEVFLPKSSTTVGDGYPVPHNNIINGEEIVLDTQNLSF